MNVKLDDGSGREYSIHYLCAGAVNSSLPVFMIEGDSGRSHADFLPLQRALGGVGRRSCVWDKPGLGFSGYLFSDTRDYSAFYHQLMTGLDQSPPYAMVGYGAGEWFCRSQKSLFHNCLAHAYIGTGKIITFAFHFRFSLFSL